MARQLHRQSVSVDFDLSLGAPTMRLVSKHNTFALRVCYVRDPYLLVCLMSMSVPTVAGCTRAIKAALYVEVASAALQAECNTPHLLAGKS